MPAAFTVTISSVVSGLRCGVDPDADCDALAATFLVERLGTSCTWWSTYTINILCSPDLAIFNFIIQYDEGTGALYFNLLASSGSTVFLSWEWRLVLAQPFNCCTTRVLPFYRSSAVPGTFDPEDFCDFTLSTATIQPYGPCT